MFNIFSSCDALITEKITVLATKPIAVIAGGITIVAVPALTLWTIYRGYLIMAGLSNNPFMQFIKDMTIKAVIIMMAASSGFVTVHVQETLEGTRDVLAQELEESENPSIFKNIEGHINGVILLIQQLEYVGKEPPTSEYDKLKEAYGDDMAISDKVFATLSDLGKSAKAIFDIEGAFIFLMQFINLAIVFTGLFILGLSSFLVVIVNKIFLMFCIGFAPLFIMFLAFDGTKAWFSSWLNNTLGYALSYPLTALGVNALLKIYTELYKPGELNFLGAAICLGTSIIFSALIGRLGDIASGWFGGQNISDGTALAMGAMGGKAATRVATTAKGATYAAGATARAASATARGGKNAATAMYRMLRRGLTLGKG